MPPLPDAIILVLALCAPRCSRRVWCHAQWWRLGAMWAPRARTVTAALRGLGLATARRVTHDQRVLHRAPWSTRQAGRLLWGWLSLGLVPAGATIVLGADDPVARRAGRKIKAKGCDREAVRSSQQPVSRGCGLPWVSMRLVVPGPWSRRVWALPVLTTLARPTAQPSRRRPQTSPDWVRHLRQHVRRWRPGRQRVLVGDGGVAAVARAWACVTHTVVMVSRVRWDAARYHPPGPQPPGQRGPNPVTGTRQRRWQAWAARAEPPGEDVAGVWYGGPRKPWWVFSPTAWWSSRGLLPVDIRSGLVCDPEGKLRLDACCWTDLQATPAHILAGVVRRWSVEVTCQEVRAPRGVETQRQWSDHAIARPTPVLMAWGAIVTRVALRLSHPGPILVPATAWAHNAEPTGADCLALGRRPLGCTRYVVHSAAEADGGQFPREAVARLIHGFSLAA